MQRRTGADSAADGNMIRARQRYCWSPSPAVKRIDGTTARHVRIGGNRPIDPRPFSAAAVPQCATWTEHCSAFARYHPFRFRASRSTAPVAERPCSTLKRAHADAGRRRHGPTVGDAHELDGRRHGELPAHLTARPARPRRWRATHHGLPAAVTGRPPAPALRQPRAEPSRTRASVSRKWLDAEGSFSPDERAARAVAWEIRTLLRARATESCDPHG